MAVASRFGFTRIARGLRKHRARWAAWLAMASRLWPYMRKRRRHLGFAVAFGAAYTAVGVAEPWALKLIVDSVLLGHPLPSFLRAPFGPVAGSPVALLNTLVVAIVALALAKGVFYYYQQVMAAQVGQRTAADLRLDLYRHLQRLSFSFHDRRRTGDMLARLTSDIRFLRVIFVSLPISLTGELFLLLSMTVVMLAMDWQLALLSLVSVPAIALLLRTYQGPMRKALRRQRDREGDIATTAAEVLGAIKVVKSFGREDHEAERFSGPNKRSLRTGLKATRLEAKLRWYAEVTVAVVTALVMAVAARRALSGALLPGDLIVFVTYLRAFNRPLRRVSRMAERTARGVAAGERVFEMFSVEPEVAQRPAARRARNVRGGLTFESVAFRHRRGPQVLRDVSLSIEPGQRVALVGSTGAGKSTMASLIPRFYDPTAGVVRLDGRDLRDLKLKSLRDQIALVFQEPVMFAASVAENIGYGRPGATPDDIVRAARRAGIHEVVASLSDGYDTVVGERGGTLSGGQRQCVAIARALIKDAPVVILDEPLTGLDAQSANLVLSALEPLMEGRTVITISHQMVSLRHAERIVVLEDGRIVEDGTHAELRQAGGAFGEFERLQTEALAS